MWSTEQETEKTVRKKDGEDKFKRQNIYNGGKKVRKEEISA
jgi:hypothetical protein